MLTGDSKEAGIRAGEAVGIDRIYTGLLPEGKSEKMGEILAQKSENGKVLFVGDGINDAPVLALSDVGIAMGGLGSDAAIEAADVILMNDALSKIPVGIKLSRFVHKLAIQNITFSLCVKLLFLVMGAAGIATMWEAVFADVGVAMIAILNSLRPLRKKF